MNIPPYPDDASALPAPVEGDEPRRRPRRRRPPKPRLWTVFTAYAVAFAGSLAVQVALGVLLAIIYVANKLNAQQMVQDLPALLSNPTVFMAVGGMSQWTILMSGLIPGLLSAEPWRVRLGMVRSTMPLWGYPFLMVGSWVSGILGIWLSTLLPVDPDDSVKKLYENITWGSALPFLLFISLVPGYVEEMFFRGYMQRRLLQRWPAWAAILLTSFLFAVMHIVPHTVIFAFMPGIWLGVLAWRTGSIWPGVACHAFINGSLNLLQLAVKFRFVPEEIPDQTLWWIVGIGGGTILVCFLCSLWLLIRYGPVPSTAVAAPTA
jgi:membrane protease YdiL (CAAX protease family)